MILILIQLTWTIWRAPTNAGKRGMGFNSAFKGLMKEKMMENYRGRTRLHLFWKGLWKRRKTDCEMNEWKSCCKKSES